MMPPYARNDVTKNARNVIFLENSCCTRHVICRACKNFGDIPRITGAGLFHALLLHVLLYQRNFAVTGRWKSPRAARRAWRCATAPRSWRRWWSRPLGRRPRRNCCRSLHQQRGWKGASAICHMAWMTWDGMGINNWWSPMGTGLFWEPPDGPLTIDVVTKIAMKEPWTYGKYRLETMYFNICIGWHTSFSSTRGFLLHKPKIGIQKQ